MGLNKISQVVQTLQGWARPQGYDPMIIFTHGYLETGGYTCKLSEKNNFFGMFATADWWGDVYETLTHEYETVNGVVTKVPHMTKFKAFDTPLHCFVAYDQYIQMKFPESYKHRTEYKTYYRGLMTYVEDAKGKKTIIYPAFCTAVGYESDLIKLYEKLQKGSGGYELSGIF